MEKQFAEQCFAALETSHSPSALTEEALEAFAQKYGVTLPEDYQTFLSACAYDDLELDGVLDNFMFEDDAEVTLYLPGQPEGAELDSVMQLYDSFPLLLEGGYLPLGELDEDAILCLNAESGTVSLVDEEELSACETAEDVNEACIPLLESLEQVLKCFFLGERQTCIEDEDNG